MGQVMQGLMGYRSWTFILREVGVLGPLGRGGMGPDSDAHRRPLAVAGKTDWGKARARPDPGSHWRPLLATARMTDCGRRG